MNEVTVTYLEMWAPPAEPLAPAPRGVEVRECQVPTARFYRYLYDGVGSQWLWTDRRNLSDEDLLGLVRDPAVHIHVLYHEGSPAGYSEIVWGLGENKLQYFGLLPEFIGLGLGRWWLEWTVHELWRTGPSRVWVHTCTLDHPRALPLYHKVGFQAYRSETVVVERVII